MSVLHDHPVVGAADIVSATQTLLPTNDLASQTERIRITLHPLGIDELSKLWTGFSMQYRLSAAYEVGVALIEKYRAIESGATAAAKASSGSAKAAITASPIVLTTVPLLIRTARAITAKCSRTQP